MNNKSSNKINPTAVIIGVMLAVTLIIILFIVKTGILADKNSSIDDTQIKNELESEELTKADNSEEIGNISEKEVEVKDVTVNEVNAFNTGYDAYDELLGKIVIAIDNEDASETGEYSYIYGRFGKMESSNFGYALIDINNDNNYELVLGENGTDEYPSILYDMYMIVDKKMLHVFSGGERDRFYATDIDNAFIEEASSSADDYFMDTFLVEDGNRKSAEFYVEPKKINLILTPFKNR